MLGKLLVELRSNYLGTAQTPAFTSYPLSHDPKDITDSTKQKLQQIGRWDYYQYLVHNPTQVLTFEAYINMNNSLPLAPSISRYRLAAEGFEEPFPFFVDGISGAEATHRWTSSNTFTLKIPAIAGGRKAQRIIFRDTAALVTDNHNQNVAVFLGTTKIDEFLYDITQNRKNIEVPITTDKNTDSRGNILTVFIMPDAISPKELGLSEDPRNLGLSLNIIEIIYQ